MKKLADDPTTGDGDSSPALEAKRRIEVELRMLDLEERRENLISRETVEACLAEWSSVMRTAYEQLGRSFGADAQDVMEQAVNDAMVAAEKFRSTDDSKD
jgi:hypothetical protein